MSEDKIVDENIEEGALLEADEVAEIEETGEEEGNENIDGDDTVNADIDTESETGEEEDKKKAPEWVREVRAANRTLTRRVKELEAQLAPAPAEVAAPKLGAKPKLADLDYDDEKYELALDKWHEDKKAVDKYQEESTRKKEAEQGDWNKTLSTYNAARASRIAESTDFEDAEDVVVSTLSIEQQGIILHAADNAVEIVAALGKNPEQVAKLAKITDPIKFSFAVARWSREIMKKNTIPPEKTVVTSGRVPIRSSEAQLEKLRAEAEKTGDYTKVRAYKAKIKKSN